MVSLGIEFSLPDFIGPYTWYKKLESRGKTTLMPLRGGKEVTVLPPDRYRDRFRKAMDENFLMVPGTTCVSCSLVAVPHADNH